jgi:hypothetical protein
MANTELQNLDVAAAWSSTCSLAGSDSAFPTQSFKFPRSVLDAVYAQQGATNTFTQPQIIGGARIKPFTDSFSSPSLALVKADGTFGAGLMGGYLAYFGIGTDDTTNVFVLINANANGQVTVASAGRYGFANINGGSLSAMNAATDTAIMRNSAGVLEVNNGTAGTLATLRAGTYEGGIYHTPGGTEFWLGTGGLMLSDANRVMWSNSFNPISVTDTGLGRASAGVVEVNNGTLGTLRDLSARNVSVNGSAAVQVAFVSASINFKNTGNTTIFTVPAGKTFYCTGSAWKITALTSITTGPTVDLEDEFSDFVGRAPVPTDLKAVTPGNFIMNPPEPATSGGLFPVPAGSQVNVAISSGAVGTTMTGVVTVFGYLL